MTVRMAATVAERPYVIDEYSLYNNPVDNFMDLEFL